MKLVSWIAGLNFDNPEPFDLSVEPLDLSIEPIDLTLDMELLNVSEKGFFPSIKRALHGNYPYSTRTHTNSKKNLTGSDEFGYNAISLNSWQHPTTVSLFFYVPISAAHSLLMRGLSAMGAVLVNGNVPAVHDGESIRPHLFGEAFKSQTRGGHHA